MWMRIAFVLAALLIWDMATTADGHSALERAGRLLMSFEPVRDLVDYAEDDLVEDVKSLTAAVSGDAAAVMASFKQKQEQIKHEKPAKSVTKTLLFLFTLLALALTNHFMG